MNADLGFVHAALQFPPFLIRCNHAFAFVIRPSQKNINNSYSIFTKHILSSTNRLMILESQGCNDHLERLKNLFFGQPQKENPLVESTTKKEKGPKRCSHHFGYLNSLPEGEPIPQECLTCEELLECRNTI